MTSLEVAAPSAEARVARGTHGTADAIRHPTGRGTGTLSAMKESVLVCSFTLRQAGIGERVVFQRKATARAIRILGGAAIAETAEVVPAHRVDFNGFLLAESECAPPGPPAPAR